MATTLLDGETISRDDTTTRPTAGPLSLSDDQMTQVMNAAEPLQPDDRSRFLADVAAALQGRELGDGIVARICAETQRRYLTPPDLSRGRDQSRWR